MLILKTINDDSVILQKSDIILIKSHGDSKTKILLRGSNKELIIKGSFEDIKFAINNKQDFLDKKR